MHMYLFVCLFSFLGSDVCRVCICSHQSAIQLESSNREIKWGCNRARAKRYVRRATRDQVLRWHINFQDQQNEGQLSSGGQAGVLQFYFYTHPDPIFQWLNKNRFFQMSVQYCSRRCFVMVTCCIFCCTISIFTGISWNRLCERSVKMETVH